MADNHTETGDISAGRDVAGRDIASTNAATNANTHVYVNSPPPGRAANPQDILINTVDDLRSVVWGNSKLGVVGIMEELAKIKAELADLRKQTTLIAEKLGYARQPAWRGLTPLLMVLGALMAISVALDLWRLF